MFGNNDVDLLQGENLDLETKPHTLSFLKYYTVSIYLVGIFLFLKWFDIYLSNNSQLYNLLIGIFDVIPGDSLSVLIIVILWLLLLLGGFVIGTLWINKLPLFYFILVGASVSVLYFYLEVFVSLFLILFSASGIWVISTEAYRRSHKYFVTNYRVIMSKRFFNKEEREIMYDKITDVYIKQGILGRIFNYGTIIPISSSGIGVGSDSASASAIAGTSVKKSFFGISFGGGKSVKKPRAATYLSLHGIPNPRRIRTLIGNRRMETREAPILRRIEGLLKDKDEERDNSKIDDSFHDNK